MTAIFVCMDHLADLRFMSCSITTLRILFGSTASANSDIIVIVMLLLLNALEVICVVMP